MSGFRITRRQFLQGSVTAVILAGIAQLVKRWQVKSVMAFDDEGIVFPVYFPDKEPNTKVFLPIVTR